MEMALSMGAFQALDQNEMFDVDGGDTARQKAIAKNRKSGSNLGSTKTAVSAQSAVTGSLVGTIGAVCLVVPGLEPIGAVCTVAGLVCSYAGFATMG